MASIYLLTLSEILLIFTTTVFVVYIIQYHWKRRELYRLAAKLPGPIAFPIIGAGYIFFGSFDDFLYKIEKIIEDYEEPVKIWIGNHLFLIVHEPETLKLIYNHPKCINKADIYKIMEIVVGHGLFTAPADTWKKHRRSISPTFNQRLLNSYVPIFYQNVIDLDKKLEKELNKVFDVSHIVEASTLTTVCQTSMGINLDDKSVIGQFSALIETLLHNIHKRIVKPLYQNDFIYYNMPIGYRITKTCNAFNTLTKRIIQDKRTAMKQAKEHKVFEENNNTKFKPFLELLLELVENGEQFTDEEVRDEVATLLIAGVDTTATALSFFLVMLGLYPEVQEKVYQEAIEVLGPNGSIEYKDLTNLKYIERCIYETLRLFPIGPATARNLEEDIELGDKILPKGSSVVFFMFHTHRSAKYWPDPLKFDPDRFLPEEVAKRHPYAYVAFAAGPRNCIGSKYGIMALKTFIGHLIRKYKISTPYKSIEDIKVRQDIIIRPVNGHKIQLERRT